MTYQSGRSKYWRALLDDPPPVKPYVWRGAGRARELEVAAELEAMRDCIRGRLDAMFGPGAGVHAYRQCAGDCRYCAAGQPAEGELCG